LFGKLRERKKDIEEKGGEIGGESGVRESERERRQMASQSESRKVECGDRDRVRLRIAQ